jgi:hypothetical protein
VARSTTLALASSEVSRVCSVTFVRPVFVRTTAFGAWLHRPRQPDSRTWQSAPTASASSSISTSTASAPRARQVPAWQTKTSALIVGGGA